MLPTLSHLLLISPMEFITYQSIYVRDNKKCLGKSALIGDRPEGLNHLIWKSRYWCSIALYFQAKLPNVQNKYCYVLARIGLCMACAGVTNNALDHHTYLILHKNTFYATLVLVNIVIYPLEAKMCLSTRKHFTTYCSL